MPETQPANRDSDGISSLRISDAEARNPVSAANLIDEYVSNAAANMFRTAPIPLTVFNAAQVAMNAVSVAADASPEATKRACRAGCSSCCYLMVSITPCEAIFIAQQLRATRSSTDFAATSARIAANATRIASLTIEGRANARISCALLSADGACSIHSIRPLGCRGWTSFDKTACDAALRDAISGHSGPQDRLLHAAASAATDGLSAAARRTGKIDGHYEFHGAILRCIETPDAAERWLGGEDVFAGCARVTSDLLRRCAPN